jgi:hypothetical protein
MLRRAILASFVGIITVCALTACDPASFPGPVAMQLHGDVVAVAVCEQIDANIVLISHRGPSRGNHWHSVVDAEGAATLQANQTFTSASLPDGMKQISGEPVSLDHEGSLSVYIRGMKDGDEVYWESEASVADLERAGDAWIQSDGRSTSNTCD